MFVVSLKMSDKADLFHPILNDVYLPRLSKNLIYYQISFDHPEFELD